MLTANIPPLENGDRLNRFEFERRYGVMPVVYMAAALQN